MEVLSKVNRLAVMYPFSSRGSLSWTDTSEECWYTEFLSRQFTDNTLKVLNSQTHSPLMVVVKNQAVLEL